MFSGTQPLHFTGAGGIGMSSLAEILHRMGCAVTGSDAKRSPSTERLGALGINIAIGHAAENLPDGAAALVVTSAVGEDNPEFAEARRRGIPIVRRGELLAELMRGRRSAAVAGSHGKTTTSSMLASIAVETGLDPSAAIGSTVPAFGGSNARLGAGEWFIAESDESDGSFLELSPEIAIITNIDREHLDHYGDFESVRRAFLQFSNRVPFHGAVIACADDLATAEVIAASRRRVVWYGRSESAAIRIADESCDASGSRFNLTCEDGGRLAVQLPVVGRHNVLNAAAALAAAMRMGIPGDVAAQAISKFRGPGRRMEWRGSARGIDVIDDYGHHPTEVKTTLEALRLLKPGRLVVIFQPHRYTRTAALMDEFAGAFDSADEVFVLSIYEASEQPIPGVSGEALAGRIRGAGHERVSYAGAMEGAARSILPSLRPGDLVLTLGAGSVTSLGPQLLDLLRQLEAAEEGADGEA
jgi:UDP-N-acetylmuramate--alanine ligase